MNERTNAAVQALIEEFIEWWHEHREGSPNAAYLRVDRFVKEAEALSRSPRRSGGEEPDLDALTRRVMQEINANSPGRTLAEVPTLMAFGPIRRALTEVSAPLAVSPEGEQVTKIRKQILTIPVRGVGKVYFASRYDTENEHVLYIRGLGDKSYDIRIPKLRAQEPEQCRCGHLLTQHPISHDQQFDGRCVMCSCNEFVAQEAFETVARSYTPSVVVSDPAPPGDLMKDTARYILSERKGVLHWKQCRSCGTYVQLAYDGKPIENVVVVHYAGCFVKELERLETKLAEALHAAPRDPAQETG